MARSVALTAYSLVRPVLNRMDPETAHGLTVRALKSGLVPRLGVPDDPLLHRQVWGMSFPNPVGLAAGFDKDAEVTDAMLGLGFGFVEAGTVTPLPQPGNARPRLFRLTEDGGVINRFGFNSAGVREFRSRLERRRAMARPGIVGANVGKNKDSADAVSDYVKGIEALTAVADYLVCNVSSPNTPGLRSLQQRSQIEDLMHNAVDARKRSAVPGRPLPPLLVKVSPDLAKDEIGDIAEAAFSTGIDGLVVGNTTVDRPPGLRSRHAGETGGLSGLPLLAKATACLSEMYRATGGRLPLVGVGGITSGRTAYEKIRAGASLVQLYSSLVFNGPGLVERIKRELCECLRADGFTNVADATGADHR